MTKVLDNNSESQYAVQILDKKTGDVVQFAAGFPVERLMVEGVCAKVAAKGVGVFRTQAKVVAAVKEALHELLDELKREV